MKSTRIQIHLPPVSDGRVSHDLTDLTQALSQAGADISGGVLGGEYGYGAYFENDTFMMHPFCWCDAEDCPWCFGCECPDDAWEYTVSGQIVSFDAYLAAGNSERRDFQKVDGKECDYCAGRVQREPNFRHKLSGSTVSWYKYIGRSMEVDLRADWREIFDECVQSVGA